MLKNGVCSEGECGGLLIIAWLCEETEGDEEGAGEFKVDGERDEHGEELSGLETGGILPPRKRERDESGRTKGRGFGLAFGRERRFPTNSLLVSYNIEPKKVI